MSFISAISPSLFRPRSPAPPPLEKPSLEGLAYLLRHPERWPKGFTWCYAHVHYCALGLAMSFWAIKPLCAVIDRMAVIDRLGLNAQECNRIFYDQRPPGHLALLNANPNFQQFELAAMRAVKPEQIAAAIDKLLAERETRASFSEIFMEEKVPT